MIAAGLLRLGRFTRFVSHSVMIGFLSGVAVNIIAGQIPDLTGAPAEGSLAVQKAWDVLIHPEPDRSGVGPRRCRRLRPHRLAGPHPDAAFSAVVALALPTIVVVLVRCGCRPGRGPGRHPARHPPTGLALAVGLLVVAARRRAGGGGDRPRAGCRRRRVRARTTTARARTPTSTSSPRASATSPRGSSRASPSAVRSARPP